MLEAKQEEMDMMEVERDELKREKTTVLKYSSGMRAKLDAVQGGMKRARTEEKANAETKLESEKAKADAKLAKKDAEIAALKEKAKADKEKAKKEKAELRTAYATKNRSVIAACKDSLKSHRRIALEEAVEKVDEEMEAKLERLKFLKAEAHADKRMYMSKHLIAEELAETRLEELKVLRDLKKSLEYVPLLRPYPPARAHSMYRWINY